MKRTALSYLNQWLNSINRKPVLIRGARQVGKSTLVRLFCEDCGYSCVEVNCEENPQLKSVFDTMNIDLILKEFEFGLNAGSPFSQETLIFIDEIQAIPSAIQCLRYFYEKHPELPVIAAGSLLEFSLAKGNISMPVGRVEYLWLGPMTFTEYLLTQNQAKSLEYLQSYTLGDPFSVSIHQNLLSSLREYCLIGGMPESIKNYIETKTLDESEKTLKTVTQTYRDDLNKHVSGTLFHKAQLVFDYMAKGAGKKVKYVNISRETSSKSLEEAIELLTKAMIITKVHKSDGNFPLNANYSEKQYKLYSLDIGILSFLSAIRNLRIEEIMNLEQVPFTNKGTLAEQFICQHLLYQKGFDYRPELHYWFRDEKNKNAEVDFCVSQGQNIIPIEVKSGKSGTLKSLQQFCFQKDCTFAVRFDLNPPSLQDVAVKVNTGHGPKSVSFTLLSLPIYMVEFLSTHVSHYL